MQKEFFTSDGATLSYGDAGEGEVLILLHGWSQSAAMFHHQMAHFSARCRVIAPDFRGHGTSPAARGGYRVHRFARDIAELMDHEGIGKASVLGWSLGASVLWAYIDLHGTDRLDRLVFLDEPAAVMRQPGMTDGEAVEAGALFDAATMARIAEAMVGPDGAATRGGFLDGMVTKGLSADLRAFLLAENLKGEPRAMASLFANHCSIDWRDLFGRVDRPTLVIGGRVSHVDARSQDWIARQIPGAELVVFDERQGGAHFPFLERPDVFNDVLDRFLDGAVPGPSRPE